MSHKRFKMFQQRAERDSHCMFLWSTCSVILRGKKRRETACQKATVYLRPKKTCRTGNSIWIQHSVCVCARGRELLLVRASSFRLTRAQSSLANLPISWASIRWLIFSSLQMSLGDNGCGAKRSQDHYCGARRVCENRPSPRRSQQREPPPFEWETATSGIYWCAARGDQGGWKKKTQQRTCSAL